MRIFITYIAGLMVTLNSAWAIQISYRNSIWQCRDNGNLIECPGIIKFFDRLSLFSELLIPAFIFFGFLLFFIKKHKSSKLEIPILETGKKPVRLPQLILVQLFNLMLLAFSLSLIKDSYIYYFGEKGVGVVTELKKARHKRNRLKRYAPIVSFQTKRGETYTLKGDPEPRQNFSINQKVDVKYLGSNPNLAIIESQKPSTFLTLFFLLLNSSLLYLFFVDYKRYMEREKEIKFLKQRGTKVLGKIIGTQKSRKHKKDFYELIYEWVDGNGKKFSSTTSEFKIDLSQNEQHLIGKEIPIIIDPNDPSKHWVEIDDKNLITFLLGSN